jgi:plasmid stability protein
MAALAPILSRNGGSEISFRVDEVKPCWQRLPVMALAAPHDSRRLACLQRVVCARVQMLREYDLDWWTAGRNAQLSHSLLRQSPRSLTVARSLCIMVPYCNHIGVSMANLTIKNIPETVYRELKRQAARHHRSLNQEVIACLEAGALSVPLDPDQFLAQVRKLIPPLRKAQLNDRQLNRLKRQGRL